jgi:hypothetical protein
MRTFVIILIVVALIGLSLFFLGSVTTWSGGAG